MSFIGLDKQGQLQAPGLSALFLRLTILLLFNFSPK